MPLWDISDHWSGGSLFTDLHGYHHLRYLLCALLNATTTKLADWQKNWFDFSFWPLDSIEAMCTVRTWIEMANAKSKQIMMQRLNWLLAVAVAGQYIHTTIHTDSIGVATTCANALCIAAQLCELVFCCFRLSHTATTTKTLVQRLWNSTRSTANKATHHTPLWVSYSIRRMLACRCHICAALYANARIHIQSDQHTHTHTRRAVLLCCSPRTDV